MSIRPVPIATAVLVVSALALGAAGGCAREDEQAGPTPSAGAERAAPALTDVATPPAPPPASPRAAAVESEEPYPPILEPRADGPPAPAPYLPIAKRPDLLGDGMALPSPPPIELDPTAGAGSPHAPPPAADPPTAYEP
ncbi:MAG: hypothetical protein R3E88_11230 [Myxococcota bacterium]|nr:hypothetical protein [Myxococcales bacterium]